MWCKKCRLKTVFIKTQTCPICNQLKPRGSYCSRHRRDKNLGGIFAVGYFKDENLKKVIHSYKYEGLSALSYVLAETLSDAMKRENLKFDLVSFVPITRKRQSWRGYNQAEELAKKIAKIFSVPLAPQLKKIADTKPQVGLTKKERQKNLEGKFNMKSKNHSIFNGKRILLIDDVVTTGTTLNECSLVYKKLGAKSVWGAVLAKE